MTTEITTRTAGDGCCPDGANASTDSDCPAHCGDGVVDSNEKCEVGDVQVPCPTSCDDKDPCSKDTLVGSAAQCTAACMNTAITKAIGGDLCCPRGANAETDSDCSTKCGDGVVTGNETCDPRSESERCPASCDDGDACTMDKVNGSAAQCTAECSNTPITTARNGDGCCPAGTLRRDDSDCTTECASPGDCGTTPECKKWQCNAGNCVSAPAANASCSGGTCTADGTCMENPPPSAPGRAFQNGKSSLCLGISGGSAANDAPAGQYTCDLSNSSNNQHWEERSAGSNVNLVNKKSGRCLGVSGGSTADGALIGQYACALGDPNNNQAWHFNPLASGYFQIVNGKSGKCIGVDGGSTANGATLLQFPCTTDGAINNQSWSYAD